MRYFLCVAIPLLWNACPCQDMNGDGRSRRVAPFAGYLAIPPLASRQWLSRASRRSLGSTHPSLSARGFPLLRRIAHLAA